MSVPPAADRVPLRRDAELNRQRIVEAARNLIGERGLDVSHAQIAQRADVGVGTVYRRFPTLDGLYDEIFADRLQAVLRLLRESEAIADPWDALRYYVEGNCVLQSHNRGLADFMQSNRGTGYTRDARERISPLVTRLVNRARRAGAIRAEVRAADLAVIFAITSSLIDASAAEDPTFYRRYLAVLLDGLLLDPRAAEPLPGRAPTAGRLELLLTRWPRPRK